MTGCPSLPAPSGGGTQPLVQIPNLSVSHICPPLADVGTTKLTDIRRIAEPSNYSAFPVSRHLFLCGRATVHAELPTAPGFKLPSSMELSRIFLPTPVLSTGVVKICRFR